MSLWQSLLTFGSGLLQVEIVRYLVSPVAFAGVLFAGWIITQIWSAAGRKISGTGISWGQTVFPACLRPLHTFFLLTGSYAALLLFPNFDTHAALLAFFTKVYRSLMVVLVAWVFCNLASVPNLKLSNVVKRMDIQSNQSVLPLFSKAMRFVVVALAVLIIAQEWNFSISGLLAGLGLGGLALSLAAKDMLASIFGGLVILLDKPFKIGDWIESSGIEGTVEDITFRSVKVRTFAQAVVTMPNAQVVDSPITNWSRMGKRRVVLKLELDVRTSPEHLRAAKGAILHAIKTKKGIHSETATVSFDDLTGVSLLMTVTYYTKTTKWEAFLSIREDVLLTAMQLLKKYQVPLAIPVQQVYMVNDRTKTAESLAATGNEKNGLDK